MSGVIESIHDAEVSIATLRALPLIMKRSNRYSEDAVNVNRRKIVNVSEHKWENGQRGIGVIKFQLRTFSPSIEIEKVFASLVVDVSEVRESTNCNESVKLEFFGKS